MRTLRRPRKHKRDGARVAKYCQLPECFEIRIQRFIYTRHSSVFKRLSLGVVNRILVILSSKIKRPGSNLFDKRKDARAGKTLDRYTMRAHRFRNANMTNFPREKPVLPRTACCGGVSRPEPISSTTETRYVARVASVRVNARTR